MNFWAQYKRNQRLLLFVTGTLIWLVLLFWGEQFSIAFYFDGSFHQHQSWFPRLYFFSYLFCRLLLPLIYCTWLIGFLLNRNIKSLTKWSFLLSSVFLLSYIIQYYFSFKVVLYIGLPLITILIFEILHSINFLLRVPKTILPWLIVEKTGIFFLYLTLCISLPRFHPFAKYTMFDKFAPTTYVYQLKDENDSLLPIEQYSTLTNDQLYTIGEAILKNQGSTTTTLPISDSLLGKAMIKHFFENQYPNKSTLSAISFYRLEYTIANNKIVTHKYKLGVYNEE